MMVLSVQLSINLERENGMIDPLDGPGPLTEYDYRFLLGDEVFWPSWGAALGTVMEWCKNQGYGSFGDPTEYGREAMKAYELNN